MTRYIDADKLLEWADNVKQYGELAGCWESDIVHHHELEEKINELATTEESSTVETENDPWCYDLDKAPHKTMLLLTDGTSYSVGEKYIDVAGNNRLMPYDHYTLDDEPEAWMPIPEPKGVDN